MFDEAWRDFAHNRSIALARLRERKEIDYALIIDADDVLVLEDGFEVVRFKRSLSDDSYYLSLRQGSLVYDRPLICSNRIEYRYRGVLHEFLEGPSATWVLAGLHILSNREGARSRDPQKYRKDAQILEEALHSETDAFLRCRYTFYLAQSYRDSGEAEKALANYLKRAETRLLDRGGLYQPCSRPAT